MNIAAHRTLTFASEAATDAFVAEHAGDVDKVTALQVRLRRAFKLVPMTDAEVREWNFAQPPRPVVAMPIFAWLIFFMFGCLGVGAHAGEGLPARAAFLGAPPALPSLALQIADAMPDPRGYEALGWLIAGLAAIVVIIGGVFAAVIGGLTIVEKIRGKTKVEAETKASNEGPGRIEFDLHIEHLSNGMGKLQAGQDEIMKKLEQWSGEQYRARGRMHRDINGLKNAMHFWAGKLSAAGDPDAKRLIAILEGENHEEGDL